MPERLAPPRPELSLTRSDLQLLQQGDNDAWTQLHTVTKPPMRAVCHRLQVPPLLHEEVLYETYDRFFTTLQPRDEEPDYDTRLARIGQKPQRMLCVMTKNTWMDELRRRYRQDKYESLLVEPRPYEDDLDEVDNALDGAPRAEAVRTLFESNLQPRDKRVFTLLMHDATPEEITEDLGMTDKPGGAKVVTFRARERARKVLAQANITSATA